MFPFSGGLYYISTLWLGKTSLRVVIFCLPKNRVSPIYGESSASQTWASLWSVQTCNFRTNKRAIICAIRANTWSFWTYSSHAEFGQNASYPFDDRHLTSFDDTDYHEALNSPSDIHQPIWSKEKKARDADLATFGKR